MLSYRCCKSWSHGSCKYRSHRSRLNRGIDRLSGYLGLGLHLETLCEFGDGWRDLLDDGELSLFNGLYNTTLGRRLHR